jgi:subtilisin family serine protease
MTALDLLARAAGRLLRPVLFPLLALGLVAPAAAKDEAVAGEIVVRLRHGADVAPLLVKHGLSLTGRVPWHPIYRLKVIGTASVGDKVRALLRETDVKSAEPNFTYQVFQSTKNVGWAIGDPVELRTRQWAASAIRLDRAAKRSTGQGMRVAVLDTGVDRLHPVLAGRLLPGYDFVDNDADPSEVGGTEADSFGHGTHVAGLVALVAPDARILPLRMIDTTGTSNLWTLTAALVYAVDPDGNPATDDGAHVINLSLSTLTRTQLFGTVANLVSCSKRNLEVLAVVDWVRCLAYGGAVIVAAAGNHASDRLYEYPAAEVSAELVSVAASAADSWLAPFSNYGWPELAAPGDRITSTVPGGGYAVWSGTSMAAPLVAGAAALLRATDRTLTASQVVDRLRARAAPLCGTSIRQLDAAATLGEDPLRNAPSCQRPR